MNSILEFMGNLDRGFKYLMEQQESGKALLVDSNFLAGPNTIRCPTRGIGDLYQRYESRRHLLGCDENKNPQKCVDIADMSIRETERYFSRLKDLLAGRCVYTVGQVVGEVGRTETSFIRYKALWGTGEKPRHARLSEKLSELMNYQSAYAARINGLVIEMGNRGRVLGPDNYRFWAQLQPVYNSLKDRKMEKHKKIQNASADSILVCAATVNSIKDDRATIILSGDKGVSELVDSLFDLAENGDFPIERQSGPDETEFTKYEKQPYNILSSEQTSISVAYFDMQGWLKVPLNTSGMARRDPLLLTKWEKRREKS